MCIRDSISCRLLVEGNAPKPLLNTEFHSVATRSPNASKVRNKSFHPIVFGPTVKQRGPWKLGWQNTTPVFSFPRRLRRSQRCWEYPSKHRRDRCERRALPDYFKCGCLHHHVSQPDTPSSVFGFILVLHLMFFQQAAGIHIQMFGEPVYCHIRLNRLGQLSGTAFPFSVINRYDLRHSFQYRVRRLLPKLILCMVETPNQVLFCLLYTSRCV